MKAKEGDGVQADKPAEDLDEDDSKRVKLDKKGKVLVDDLVKQCQHIKVLLRATLLLFLANLCRTFTSLTHHLSFVGNCPRPLEQGEEAAISEGA